MGQGFFQRRIPTLFAVIFLLVSVGLLTVFVQRQQIFQPRADVLVEPGNFQISNITDTQLVVSFTTTKAVAAQIRFGQTLSNGTLLFDDRDDVGDQQHSYTIHYFTVSSLEPGKNYVYTIEMGNQVFNNKGSGYTAKTSPYTGEAQQIDPVIGSVVDESGKNVSDALITLVLPNASPLTTLSKTSGNFLLPLRDIRTADLTNAFHINDSEVLSLTVTTPTFKTASVQVPFSNRQMSEPIQIGKSQAVASAPSPAQEVSMQQSSSFDNTTFANTSQSPTFTFPKEGDFVIDPRPLLQGTGAIGETVSIQIGVVKGTVTVDQSGNWRYQPTSNLSVGKHTAIVTFLTNQQIDATITHNFEVLPSGSQVQESATPSPTLIVSQTTPLVTPLQSPMPTVAPLKSTGTVEPLMIGLVGGLVIVFSGIALAFL